MSDQEGHGEHRGLGKIVYSAEPAEVRADREDLSGAEDEIDEAAEESFPASDPPGFASGAAEKIAPTDASSAAAGPTPAGEEAATAKNGRTERAR